MYISSKNLKMKAAPTGISKGNKKMTDNFLIWSLPSGITCPGKTKECERKCYAKKAEKMYPQTLPSRQRNFEDSKGDNFVEEMTEKINKLIKNAYTKQYKYFRIHESGDFYSEEYFKKWVQIIKKFPGITFLAFTKTKFVRDYISGLPENFNLYFSVWPDTKEEDIIYQLPLALAGDCQTLYNKRVFQCRGMCNECLHCFKTRQDVHFDIH